MAENGVDFYLTACAAAMDAVRRIHYQIKRPPWPGTCAHDQLTWPCPTERAIRQALGDSDA
jgi:hypothetical protein